MPKKGNEVFKAFKKGMEISDSYWSARKAYLSGVRQGPRETAAELAVRVEDMVLQGKWPDNETQNRHIDLYYKATAYYEIQRYIQDQSSREGNELTWEKLVQEAKRQERTVLEYKDFKMDAGNTGSTPTYDNPALNADAVGKFTRGRHSKGKAREEALEMHAESVGSGVIKEALTVLPLERNAESVASPITSKLSVSVETIPGVPPLAKARQARRRERSHLAKRPNFKQIQSYCEK